MSNNIVSFQVSKSPGMFSINNVSAGKNIKSATLLEAQNLQNKDTAIGYDDNINFSETGIQEYTLEELLAEGTQTQAEIQQVRAEEQARILAEQQRQYEQQLKELEDLYKSRDENNGLFHSIKEAEIEAQIEALEKELNVPHQPDGWDQFVKMAENPGATAVTFFASEVEGIADVGESIFDGAVQIVGGAASYVVGAIDEDAGKAMQEGIQEFVSTDWTGKGYDAFVNAAGIDPEIAYGPAHSAGQIVGQVAGYAAISMIPGAGPAVTAVVGGLAAAGSAAESAYANGATFNEAMVVSTVAGVVGGVSGAASNQLGTVAKTSTTALDVVKYTAAGAGVGMVEPIVNSGVEYATYGNNDGKSYFEYMEESGGYQKVLMGAGSGAISAGTQAYKGYSEVKPYASNPKITKEQVKIAEQNYQNHSDNFTNRKDYYDTLDYVEKKYGYGVYDSEKDIWEPNTPLDPTDPGLTRCLTEQRKQSWLAEVKSYTIDGKTKVNVGTSNASKFDQFVVKSGNLGAPGDYNFGRLGNEDPDVFINRSGGKGVVKQFERDTGLPTTDNDRIIQYSYSTDYDSITPHTGKEMGSNSQRLCGGYLPDNSTEVVIAATTVDNVGGASTMTVSIMDDSGNKLFPYTDSSGRNYSTLEDLRYLKSNNPTEYNRILGI